MWLMAVAFCSAYAYCLGRRHAGADVSPADPCSFLLFKQRILPIEERRITESLNQMMVAPSRQREAMRRVLEDDRYFVLHNTPEGWNS